MPQDLHLARLQARKQRFEELGEPVSGQERSDPGGDLGTRVPDCRSDPDDIFFLESRAENLEQGATLPAPSAASFPSPEVSTTCSPMSEWVVESCVDAMLILRLIVRFIILHAASQVMPFRRCH